MSAGTILLAGASRGLGLGLAREFAGRNWDVVATARSDSGRSALQAVGGAGRLRVETLDVTEAASIAALARSLAGHRLDVLFVVAGIGTHMNTPIAEVPPAEAAHEFLTNAHAPIVLAERLDGAVKPDGMVVFMTSVLGSIASSNGGMDLYRASKAALNMLAVGYARRHAQRRVLLMHPGWVRTDMGGEAAPLDVETSARGMADVIERERGRRGIAYLDYRGETIPW